MKYGVGGISNNSTLPPVESTQKEPHVITDIFSKLEPTPEEGDKALQSFIDLCEAKAKLRRIGELPPLPPARRR